MTALEITLIVAGVLLLLVVLAHFKTSRPDGIPVKRVHPYRRMMPYIMKGRNESIVYMDSYVRAEKLLEYLDKAGPEFGANVSHAVVGACSIGLGENPTMNHFVSGRRLYMRKGRWLTFSIKRVKKDKKSKIGVVKTEVRDGETFRGFTQRINEKINYERSGQKTGLDKELQIFGLLPRSALRLGVTVFRALDYVNLLPGGFIEGDGMYTSVFIANLGSVNMRAAFHHLYEWGTAPLFLMVGAVEDKPVVEDGEVVPAKILHLRWSYDERIDDGLSSRFGMDTVKRVLEDPFRWLGGLEEDGSVDRPMWPHPPGEEPDSAKG